MGTWGTSLFSDDLATDVRNDYRRLLEEGKSGAEVTCLMLAKYAESISDPEECSVFWLALAVAQWKLGRLDEMVKQRALSVIEDGSDLKKWENSPKDFIKRRVVLNQLHEQLISQQPEARVIKVRKRCAEIGDVICIPLPDGINAYAQYVYHDDRKPNGLGYMIQVSSLITDKEIDIVELVKEKKLLFPPVFVALDFPIRSHRWKKIGHLTVENFQFPLFRCTNGIGPGIYHDWKLWDRDKRYFLGDLPEKYRDIEIVCIWGYDLLEKRIITGNKFDERW